jgi:hypothetical protein
MSMTILNQGVCGKESGSIMSLTFRAMYELIEEYHHDLGYKRATYSSEQRLQDFRNNVVALMMELAELTDSVPWKPWREIQDQPMDKDNACREVIDIIFFLVGLCEILEISVEELETKFYYILGNNYVRIDTDYSKKMED